MVGEANTTGAGAGTGREERRGSPAGLRRPSRRTVLWSGAGLLAAGVGAMVAGRLLSGPPPGEALPPPGAPGGELWRRGLSHGVGRAAIADGRVFVPFGGTVHAPGAATGSVLWTFRTSDGRSAGRPTVADDTVYTNCWDERLYALDAADGSERWSRETPMACPGAPAVIDDVLVVGCLDGHVYGFDTTDGRPRWSFATDGQVFSTPLPVRGSVWIGSHDGRLYVLDPATGTERLRHEVGGHHTRPVHDGGLVAVISRGTRNELLVVDAAAGREVLRRNLRRGMVGIGSPVMGDGRIHLGTEGRRVEALDPRTGEAVWSVEARSPVEGLLFAEAADGTPVVCYGDSRSGPAGAGAVCCVDAADGRERWRLPTPGTPFHLAAADGVVYAGTINDHGGHCVAVWL